MPFIFPVPTGKYYSSELFQNTIILFSIQSRYTCQDIKSLTFTQACLDGCILCSHGFHPMHNILKSNQFNKPLMLLHPFFSFMLPNRESFQKLMTFMTSVGCYGIAAHHQHLSLCDKVKSEKNLKKQLKCTLVGAT